MIKVEKKKKGEKFAWASSSNPQCQKRSAHENASGGDEVAKETIFVSLECFEDSYRYIREILPRSMF